ncbi:MAG: glycoside hydrolase family 3 C-terminal domain-containing protein [Ignavibacteriae bacterium]|nr:glycoside hydrolase family 3 C-terminal domain-containing protein [Ignavibacteriota bacterium]
MKILLFFLLAFLVPVNNIPEKIILQPAQRGEFDYTSYTMKSMTLREKISQMIVSYSDGFSLSESSSEFKRLKNVVQNEKIGGIIFFKGNSVQQAELTNKLQSLAEIPLLISQDCERGTGMRLDDGSIFPSNMALGATRNKELAYQMGKIIALECKSFGVHQNYAPVMDVNNNPGNPIINVRSFGEDPKLVSMMGIQMIKGIQDAGLIATAKHFPGHGDTDVDSHSDLPVINFGMERLEEVELAPFKAAIETGVKSVMIAHLSFPALDNTPYLPSSLSKNIVDGLLIKKMGFGGLIVTDALNMDGITKHFNAKQVAVLCVEAGIDLILMPQGEKITIDAIEAAVKAGKISEERIDISVKKILDAKYKLGLNENKYVDVNKVGETVNSSESKKISQMIADESITLVKDNGNLLPFGKKSKDKKCLIISLNNGKENAMSNLFIEEFSARSEDYFSQTSSLDRTGDLNDVAYIEEEADKYDVIIIPVYAKVKIRTGTVGLPQTQLDLINKLTTKGKKVVVISYGNPYLINGFDGVEAYICAYADAWSSVKAGVKSLFGEIKFNGQLPVTINDKYTFGTGIKK